MKEILKKAHKFSNSWTGTIVIVLFIIFFIAQAFRIPSGSMKDSLLIGDHLFAKKFAYGIAMPHIPFFEVSIMPWSDSLRLVDGDKPSRGDIVIFRYPHNIKQHFVKRCVATPGDELFLLNKDLFIHFKEGDEWIKKNYMGYEMKVFAEKTWVKNPYMHKHPGIHHDEKVINYGYPNNQPLFNHPIFVVPKNEYFMMGDNRDHSNDSRFWGTVPYDYIEGTPWFVYFSIENRSYKAVLEGEKNMGQGTDHVDLKKVCGKLDIKSLECKKIWDKQMYKIRWDRMGKTPTDLETDYHLNIARNKTVKVNKDAN